MTTRRTFLRDGSFVLTAVASGRSLRLPSLRDRRIIEDPDLTVITRRALEAATASGARYADVRCTVTRRESCDNNGRFTTVETREIGVRALKAGGWGYASLAAWTPDMVPWLGTTAAALASASTCPGRPGVDWWSVRNTTPGVGTWTMPVRRDPFAVSRAEKLDLLKAFRAKIRALPGDAEGKFASTFSQQERTFASTEGGYTTQTVYAYADPGGPLTEFSVRAKPSGGGPTFPCRAPFVSPAGIGYEIFEDVHALDNIPALYELSLALRRAPTLQETGRFDVVFDGNAMAALVRGTLGIALAANRAVGDTGDGDLSYLAPLDRYLGTDAVAPYITLTADRSRSGGAATVQWDDDGIAPRETTLIQNGRIMDYLTDRECASALAPWHTRRGLAPGSAGYAAAASALVRPRLTTPNLRLHPTANTNAGSRGMSFDALVAQIQNGFAVIGGEFPIDERGSGCIGSSPIVYKVTRGKLGSLVKEAAFGIRAKEFWKRVVALGDASTSMTRGFSEDGVCHSVTAAAALVRDVHVMNAGAV